ncbi:MAG: hypothetical protein GX576_10545 [Thauera phenolivorans]|uniref:Uncharacterized protein n=1 Tax=Thauera phenolivorans TaxID=1792543 RepID=A0A7X7LWS8_9RHOO|nr:hypothetical protein [Thauera phenolivorans]
MIPVTLSQPVIFRPAPNDPFDDVMPADRDLQQAVPPDGAGEGDDPMYADRYAASQLVLSIAQFYDTTWPLSPDPTTQHAAVGYQGARLYRP